MPSFKFGSMPESDCITLSDSDDEALEILEEKISNYGGGSSAVGSKTIEVTKDMEKTILDSLRKQNVSIPEGNFKLKIYARNGGNVDLSALDLSAITNSSLLKVNNKVSTTGKASFVVSAQPSKLCITEKEKLMKNSEKSETMPFDEGRKNKIRDNMLLKEKSSEVSNNINLRTRVNISELIIGGSKRKIKEIKSVTNNGSSKSTKSTEKSLGITTAARPVGSCQILDEKYVDDKVKNVVAFENGQMFNIVRGKPIAKQCSQVTESIAVNEVRIDEFSKFNTKSKVMKVQVSNTSKHVIEELLNSKDQRDDTSKHNSDMALHCSALRTSFNTESMRNIVKPVNHEKTNSQSADTSLVGNDSSQVAEFIHPRKDSINTLSSVVNCQDVLVVNTCPDFNHTDDPSPVIYEPSPVMDEPSCMMNDFESTKDFQRPVGNDPSRAMIDNPSQIVRGGLDTAIVDDLNSEVVDDPSLHVVEDPGQEEVKDTIPQVVEDPNLEMMDDLSLEMTDASSPVVVADAVPVVVTDSYPIEVDHSSGVVADPTPAVVEDPGSEVVADPSPVVVAGPSPGVVAEPSPVAVADPSSEVDDDPSLVMVDDPSSVVVDDPSSVFEQEPSRVVMNILSRKGMENPGFVVEENLVVEQTSKSLEVDSPTDRSYVFQTDQSLNQKRKSSSTFHVKIPLLFEEIVDINIDSSAEEMFNHPDSRPTAEIDPYCGEVGSDLEALTPDAYSSCDVIDTKTLTVAVQPNSDSPDSTKPNINVNLENRSSAPWCNISDDSGVNQVVETSNFREDPASNIATVEDYDLEDGEVGECFSYEVYVDGKAADDTIKNILDTLSSNISNVTTGRKEEDMQVVPNLEEYIEKYLENYLDRLPRDLHLDRFEDIFNAVPPSNDILKSAVANIQFIHDDLVQTSTDDSILPLDVEYYNEDISSKFSDMYTTTLSDIEELIKESELESEETLTFISVEVLQNIIDFIDINQLMSELKEKAYQHFKFSGWRLTHVSKKAVEYIPGFDITLYPHLTDQVEKSFNDENLLCEEEVPEIPACISNTLTELSQNGDLFDDISTTGNEDVDSCIDMEKESMDLEEDSDLTIRKQTNCYVSMKSIPLDSISESLPSLDHEINKSGAKYSSSVTLLPSSGPKDFLWQLDSQDFFSMFGLCTHSQADEIRAKSAALAPTSVRLRRVNLNKSVNYNGSSSVKKRKK